MKECVAFFPSWLVAWLGCAALSGLSRFWHVISAGVVSCQ